jgi:UDP-N-acetylmuramate dehydrogenase
MIIIEECYPLKSFNTFAVEAYARMFAEADSLEDVRTLVGVFGNDTRDKLILGGGSNILFTENFDGVVIFPNTKGIELLEQNDENVWVKAAAGENWDEFVAFCVSNNWGGVENLSLIPGNVGACPVQNIGAYGVEVKDVIDSVETIELTTGKAVTFTNAECCFGYRDSIFKQQAKGKYLVTAVIMKLKKNPVCKIKYADVTDELSNFPEINIGSVREAIIRIRGRKLPDPVQYGNAGSFFKNPVISVDKFDALKTVHPAIPSYPAGSDNVKLPAAWLIQTSGWKGRREGNVGTHEIQPLVIINYGGATGTEIITFAKKVQQAVFAQFDIRLEMEVNIL